MNNLVAAAGLLVLAGALACGPREERGSESGNTADGIAADSLRRDASNLTDAQIAHIAVTANSLDSSMGVFARPKASSSAVRQFASDMIRDHGNSNQQAKALAQRLNLTPVEHERSRDMQEEGANKQRDLSDDRGADFDRQYIDHEVEMHEKVLRTLDDDLIPSADNAELRQLLTQARAVVASHLERARQLDRTLGGDSARHYTGTRDTLLRRDTSRH